MFPKPPNYVFTIIFILTLIAVGFTDIEISKLNLRAFELRKKQTVSVQAVASDLQQLTKERNFLKQFSKELADKYRIQNPVTTDKENNLFFNPKSRGTKPELWIDQRLGELTTNYQTHVAKYGILIRKVALNKDFTYKELALIKEGTRFLKDLQAVSLVIILATVIGLIYNLYLHEKLQKSLLEKKSKNCQSCFKMLNTTVPYATFNDGTYSNYHYAQCFDIS